MAKKLQSKMKVTPEIKTIEFGKFIRSKREEHGMSLKSFAEKMNMGYGNAKKLESGETKYITFCFVKSFAMLFGLDFARVTKSIEPNRKPTDSKLGQLIRTRRIELGFTLEKLGKKLNMTRQYINQIESGRSNLSGSDDIIVELAEALGISKENLESARVKRKNHKIH